MVASMLGTVRKSGGCFGADPSVINSMWRSAILDQHRYRDTSSRILARHEAVGSEGAFFPCDEGLSELGVNLDTLATALDAGTINASRVEELLSDLTANRIDVEAFDDTVGLTLIPSNVDLPLADKLTAAAHLPSVLEAARLHPDDQLERALHASGLCSCHVDYAVA
jgi:hypothetical protein